MPMIELSKKNLTLEESEIIIRSVIDRLTEQQKLTLVENITAGKIINCGHKAYVFADEHGGCLLTMTVSTDWPRYPLDFEKSKALGSGGSKLYSKIISEFSLNYYHATQMMTPESMKSLVLSHLNLSS